MKDIEQLFKEKLQQHQVAPPADTWEKLQDSWQQRERKKRGWWLWAAASVALLLTLGGLLYIGDDSGQPATPIAVDVPPQVAEPSIPEVPPTRDVPPEDLVAASNDTSAESVEEKSLSMQAVAEKPSQATPRPASVAEEVRLPEPLAKLERTLPAELTNPTPTTVLPEEPLLAEASAEVKPSVTIIYKSGTSDKEEQTETTNPLEKAVAFLTNIKENGVGFSELRSAKSELLTKAFSNKREPMSAE